jgi:hypothetical protein
MPREQIPPNRPVWLAIISIVAVLAAAAAFVLRLAHATPTGMLTGAGTAFVAAMTLGMSASRYLGS